MDMQKQDKKINVLHVIEQLPVGGGAESLLLTLATNINRNRFNLVFCCLNEGGEIADKLRGEGFRVQCLQNYRIRHFYRKIRDIVELAREEQIDIVHTHLILAITWSLVAALISRVPVLCRTEHGILTDKKTRRNQMLDLFFDCVIYVSESQRRDFKGEHYDPSTNVVVLNAFDEKRFQLSESRGAIRASYGYSVNDIVIGSIGRLQNIKGQEYLFRAAEDLAKRCSSIKILLVGSGPDETRLKDLARSLRLNVLFLSNRYDIPELMRAMDIYVQPSLEESFGISIAEAMYTGLPVVASKVGGIPEVISEGETGILVPPGDSKALKDALLKLVEDPGLAKSMGEKGKQLAASRFGGERYARDMERLYSSLTECGREQKKRRAIPV